MFTRSQKNRPDTLVRGTITVVALILVAARIFHTSIFERIDVIGIGLLVIAALPWVSSFVSEISVAGVVEAKFRALEQKIDETKAQADNATRRAIASEDLVIKAPPEQSIMLGSDFNALEQLGNSYVKTRSSMRRGSERTSSLTYIFRDMSIAARNINGGGEQARRWLMDNDAGKVLAGIAYSYVHNSEADVSALIHAIMTTKQPFLQYWALRAILEIVQSTGLMELNQKDIADLRSMEKQIANGTDRAFLLASINKTLDQLLG